jgi:hypothetical protein
VTELTAIDILVNPDVETIERAKVVNRRLRRSVPSGYALDSRHQPHITMLQRYVRSDELSHVFAAVEETLAATEIARLRYRVEEIRHVDWNVPGQGYAVFVVTPSPEVLALQATMLAAVHEFTESGGSSAAFFVDNEDSDINATTLAWVENFVPDQVGLRYQPHISLGFAKIEDLAIIEAEPFDGFEVTPASFAVYQLGNNGNARKLLRRWNS